MVTLGGGPSMVAAQADEVPPAEGAGDDGAPPAEGEEGAVSQEPPPDGEDLPPVDDVDMGADVDSGEEVAIEEDLEAIEELDMEALLSEPVVTASGSAAEERVLAAANVTLVSRDQIDRHGWRTLAEVLASIPGLYVIDDHVMPSVGVRGVTGGLRAGTRIVKVMINGVAINFRPDLSAFLGPSYIPMDAVDRIEIVQGPLSALYGANAFIATVNIITKKADGVGKAEVAARGTVIHSNAGGGGSAFIAQGTEDLGLTAAFSMDWLERSGLAVQRTFAGQNPNQDRYRTFFAEPSDRDVASPQSMFVQFHKGQPDHKIGRLTVQGGIQRLDSVGEFQVNSAMSHDSRYSLVNYWMSSILARKFSEKVNGALTVGFSNGRPTRDYRIRVTADDSAFYRPKFASKALFSALQMNFAILPDEQLTLRLGVDAEVDNQDVLYYQETFLLPFGERQPGDTLDLIGADADRQQLIWDVGVGLQVTSVPLPEDLEGLRLTGNVRADFIRYGDIDFPTQVSWRAGVVYQWSEALVTKLIGGQAFQTPSGVLMFAQPGFGRANNVVGNANVESLGFPGLEPQTVTGAEAIISAKIADGKLAMDLGGYFQEIQDRIQFEQLATDFIAVNAEARQNVGALANVRLKIDRIGAYATASFQRQIVDDEFVSDAPELFPNYAGTVGVNVDVPEAYLRANVHLRWAGERGASQSNVLLNNGFYELDPYFVLNLTLSTKDLKIWDENETRIFFSVRNLLDEQYSEPGFTGFDIPQLERTFAFEVRQTF